MNCLGLRVSSSKIAVVILQKNDNDLDILCCETIHLPTALSFPQLLHYIRNVILDFIRKYSIEVAALKLTEGNSFGTDSDRLNIEGVIQEAFAGSTIQKIFLGRAKSISKRLAVSDSELKDLTKNKAKPSELSVESWKLCSNEQLREACLVGLGAIND
ncbi:hypothetical protein [Acinetobacter terrae]|uniref:DUF3010 family protein n=1 Tax=Acinetobacter terrae TaxID=2731247 RepID=A0ABX1V5X1_9GAMM|nr:hypothetical protein [Acinetobacter terrae]NNH89024.1 hypothetical protein [Acinetobacter terrae]